MKVLGCVPAAVIGVLLLLLHLCSSSMAMFPGGVEAGDVDAAAAPQLRGSKGTALAPFEGGEEAVRHLTGCAPFSCPAAATPPRLHVCSEWQFFSDRCKRDLEFRVFPGSTRVCSYKVEGPMVLVLDGLEPCAASIRGVTFDLLQDGVRIRRYTERVYPYTVFGDTTAPLSVNSLELQEGATYSLSVAIKDLSGCVSLVQSYEITIDFCSE